MAWGSKTTLGSQTAIDNTTEEFLPSAGGGVSLNPGETVHVQLEIDNEHGSTVTDACEIRIYTSLDASTEDWDEVAWQAFTHKPATIAAEDYSFLISGVYRFRIGIKSAGATNTYTVSGNYRSNGVSV